MEVCAPCLAVMMILGLMYGLMWLIDPKGAKAFTRRWVEDWGDVLADEKLPSPDAPRQAEMRREAWQQYRDNMDYARERFYWLSDAEINELLNEMTMLPIDQKPAPQPEPGREGN